MVRLRDAGVPERLLFRVDTVGGLKTLLKTLRRYEERKGRVCEDPDIASKLEDIKVSFAEAFGLTEMSLEGVHTVMDLMQACAFLDSFGACQSRISIYRTLKSAL